MNKINFHTHTTFCDGKNTAEEMVLAAIEKGFSILGFSGHSMFPFGGKWHIAPRELPLYVEEINRLKEKYADKIKIFCGFECDYYPSLTCPDKEFYKELKPDFLIGSVHYVTRNNMHYGVDSFTERVKRGLEIIYKGNGKQAVIDYFEAQMEMLRYGNFDILGHPDLIRKRNKELNIFDVTENWYKDLLKDFTKAVKKSGVIAEINTGGKARGCTEDFYPSDFLLELFFNEGIPVCINSDAHNTDLLDFGFEEALKLAKKTGYKELVYPCIGTVKI
ncbi:MAG: histidinol-phosphatase [Treponema sp.]|nr:histidinol-phosphatase [Treponema sp.]